MRYWKNGVDDRKPQRHLNSFSNPSERIGKFSLEDMVSLVSGFCFVFKQNQLMLPSDLWTFRSSFVLTFA